MIRERRLLEHPCEWCNGPIYATRADARTCSKAHRQAKARADADRARTRRPAPEKRDTTAPARLAYADPPYPGKARRCYGDQATYAGEVDHAALLERLSGYDGWALSTSAAALQTVLALAPPGTRVAAWTKPHRPHKTAAISNAWEPVLYQPARPIPGAGVVDHHATGRVRQRPTLPDAVIGMKPPSFCTWVFQLLGATDGDTLDDLFPGSGIVAWCWDRHLSSGAAALEQRHVA